MKPTVDLIQTYLLKLAEGLEVLGPDESREIIEEVRGHLAEAIAEAGGDEAAALAGFGSAEDLAYRVLEERGVAAGKVAAPAPAWMRVAAHAIDVVVWCAVSYLFLLPAFIISTLVLLPFHVEVDSPAAKPVVSVVLVCLSATFAWFWYFRRRNTYGFRTTGMTVVGLRRVPVGGTRRVVRSRDIPDLPKQRLGRAGAVWVAVCVVAIVGSWMYGAVTSLGEGDDLQSQNLIQETAWETSSAAFEVGDVYRMVMLGRSAEEIENEHTFLDPKILADLQARKASGAFDSYVVSGVDLPRPDQIAAHQDDGATDIEFTVDVLEYTPRGEDTFTNYRYHLKVNWADVGDGGSEGNFVIEASEQW